MVIETRERSGAREERSEDSTPFHSEESNGLTLPSARKKIQ
jgi:hypothetical protein